MIKMKHELDTCPLCGSSNMGIETVNTEVTYTLYARCYDCGLSGYKSFLKSKPIKEAKKELTDYWNHRVPVTKSKEKFNAHNTVVGKRIDAMK